MKKMKKITALILVAATILCFAACSRTSEKKFGTWFNEEFSPAYDAFVATDYGKEHAPSPDISLMITSDKYLNFIFDYIANGTKPEKGEITEEDGAYIYTENTFTQKVEIDEGTTSIRITNTISMFGEASISSVTTLREHSGKYYIQYLQPDFSEYYEVCFTAESGEVKHERTNKIPYSIFGEKIPDTFAKES